MGYINIIYTNIYTAGYVLNRHQVIYIEYEYEVRTGQRCTPSIYQGCYPPYPLLPLLFHVKLFPSNCLRRYTRSRLMDMEG